ncbi:hypothetical protein CBL_04442 [Carabus blaptoides fortunei]
MALRASSSPASCRLPPPAHGAKNPSATPSASLEASVAIGRAATRCNHGWMVAMVKTFTGYTPQAVPTQGLVDSQRRRSYQLAGAATNTYLGPGSAPRTQEALAILQRNST